jgi:hypothetical protein
MTRITILIVAVLAFAATLPAVPAQAQRDRVFVASYGSDSNPCTFGSPCKTFQNAVNVVAQGGEVTAIDSAGFGTFTISHAVTITSPNGVEAGIAAPTSGGYAIYINAGPSDIVRLNGLTVDGDGVSSTEGIYFFSGGGLNIQNCVIRNLSTGILFAPNASSQLSSQLLVSNTLVSDNIDGIFILDNGAGTGPVTGVLDHVTMANNTGQGLTVQNNNDPSLTLAVTVAGSVSANNGYGIEAYALSGPATIMVRNSTIANNVTDGLLAQAFGAHIWVTRSTITGNGTGLIAEGIGATVTSFGDNNIVGNGTNGTPSTTMGYQ